MLYKKLFKNMRKLFFNNFRENELVKLYFEFISNNTSNKNLNILDYGSGFQPLVIIELVKLLSKSGKIVSATCLDFYSNEDLNKLNGKYENITFLNVSKLEVFNEKDFDYCIISDVLHQMDIDNKVLIKVTLTNLSKICKFILIKDHFQNSYLQNTLLRIMDYAGNIFNPVEIPKRYFTNEEFNLLLRNLDLKVVMKLEEIKLYKKIWLFFNNPNLHFIYLLQKNKAHSPES